MCWPTNYNEALSGALTTAAARPRATHLAARSCCDALRRLCCMATAAPSFRCHCFSLCSAPELADFHRRLPIVRSETSPWAKYLKTVYREDAPLPVNMRSFEAFYPRLLPAAQCDSNATAPCSDESDCAGWLQADLMRNSNGTARRAWSRTPLWMLPDTPFGLPTAARVRLPNGNIPWRPIEAPSSWATSVVVMLRRPSERRRVRSGGWAEVLHHTPIQQAGWSQEGVGGYGCWFVRAVGSGVFVNVGKTAGFVNRGDSVLRSWAQQPMAASHTKQARAAGAADAGYATGARREGFDSVQITSSTGCFMSMFASGHCGQGAREPRTTHEIIDLSPACMEGHAAIDSKATLRSGCVRERMLRTGWNASRSHCACDAGSHLLNCANTRVRKARSVLSLKPTP